MEELPTSTQNDMAEERYGGYREAFAHVSAGTWLPSDCQYLVRHYCSVSTKKIDSLIDITRKQVNALKLSDSQVWASLDLRNQQVIDALLRSRDLLTEYLSKQSQSDRAEHLETRSTILNADKNRTAEAMKIHLLQSLKFSAMDERRDEICEAHHKTFQWIYQDPTASGKPWSNFVNWLQRDHGIYWINGKAGSGKSTLMRDIVDNRKKLDSIKVWSGGVPTKIVSFFFWNSGTTLQRSQIGLFRSLLYEALEDHIHLVPYVFPEELKWFEYGGHQIPSTPVMGYQWSLKQLQQAFARLTKFATTSLKLCFFIDGLDEYEGDHESLADFFKTLSHLILSSVCQADLGWPSRNHSKTHQAWDYKT